jgi:2-C-methyl-D-erythritol 2,4-cyclodiphosphate synthase
MDIRIGFGVDVHRLAPGRDLIVGGVRLASELGAVGHSDADVLIHAICDALLGALNLRDIGFNFSDTDPAFENIDSTILLTRVMQMIQERGFQLVNTDCTVILEKPKLNPHIPAMVEVLAPILAVQPECISIKATTHEKVDSFGEQRAIKAYSVCLLKR